MKLGLIIQARTGSTRLPNKMQLPFYNGQSVLELLLVKLKTTFSSNQIILATTDSKGDDAIESIGLEAGVNVFRGSEQDVLGRFVSAAEHFGIGKVVRICADNPFLDIDGLNILTTQFANCDADYLAFSLSNGTPTIKTHYGFWAECVTLKALKSVQYMTDEKMFHEHVTNYIYTNQDVFRCSFITIPQYLENNKRIRLTLDTIEDFNLQKDVYEELMKKGEGMSPALVVRYLDAHPEYYEKMSQQIVKNSK